jgi:hypothetical protein
MLDQEVYGFGTMVDYNEISEVKKELFTLSLNNCPEEVLKSLGLNGLAVQI